MSVSAVILAAGASRRFGGAKMLARVGGEPLVRRAARAFCEGGATDVVVVVAPDAPDVRAALALLPVRVVVNPRPDEGMLSSARSGVSAVPAGAAWVALCPADIPGITPAIVADVLGRLPGPAAGSGPRAVVPLAGGRRGHPLVASLSLASRILSWDASRRLSDLLREPDAEVTELDGYGPEVLRDVDTPADLAEAGR